MWRDILKSTRKEAYAKFLEEFGPEVDLRFLEVENLDDPENADLEYYLSMSNVSGEIMGDWVIQSNGANITFISDIYSQHEEFILGMFQQEYPERYQEIVEMFDETIPPKKRIINTMADEDVIYTSADLPNFHNMARWNRRKWLEQHDFCYLANGNFVSLRVRNYLMGSLISFYELKPAEETTDILRNGTSYNFGELTNIGDLFNEYKNHMNDWNFNETRSVRRKLTGTIGTFEVLQDILRGRLLTNSYYKEHLGRDGGMTLAIKKRRPGEE